MKGKELNVLLTEWEPSDGDAEEILKKYPTQNIDFELWLEIEDVIAAMQEFATLHAQRLADKTVEERLREAENPYPESVFLPISDNDMKEVVEHIRAGGFSSDALFGNWGRTVWNNCIRRVKEIMVGTPYTLMYKDGNPYIFYSY